MPGTKTYTNGWLGVTHKEYWLNNEGDTGITGEKVSDYFSQMFWRLKGNGSDYYRIAGGPFNGLIVETWNTNRVDVPTIHGWSLAGVCGITPEDQNKMFINHRCIGPATYSHEMGHHYANWSGMFHETLKTQIGYDLWLNYLRLRNQDTTNRTSLEERFAEDFEFFFGADGTANVRNPQDDAALYGKRWPDQVPGLCFFIRGAFPVFNHLKNYAYTNFSYNDVANEFTWKIGSVWQKYAGDGWFYWWSGTAWIKY